MSPSDTSDGRPVETAALARLRRDVEPLPELEERVVEALAERRLIRRGGERDRARRPLLAAAAVLALASSFALGRASLGPPAAPPPAADWALLLYEGKGFVPAAAGEARERFSEYSLWVAEARRRGQFVTGEDLVSDRGWRMVLRGDRTDVEATASPGEAAALSGVFLITAPDAEAALALAAELPHLRHGGEVIVQRVLPTATPPPS